MKEAPEPESRSTRDLAWRDPDLARARAVSTNSVSSLGAAPTWQADVMSCAGASDVFSLCRRV